MSKKLKCFIIEDEPLSIVQIQSFINTEKNLILHGFVDDIEDINSFLPQLRECDILFLDLKVKGGIIESLRDYIICLPYIISISAIPPQDYPSFLKDRKHFVLQKPMTIDRFNSCIQSICKDECENVNDLS